MSEKSFVQGNFIQVIMPYLGWGRVIEKPEKNKLVVRLDMNLISSVIQLPLIINDFSDREIKQLKVTEVEILKATSRSSTLRFTIE